MGIGFRDDEQVSGLGCAGFLRLLPAEEDGRHLGALLTVDARGIPVEFTWNDLRLNHPALWEGIDRRRYALRRLAASLLRKSAASPLFLACLAGEVPPELFREDIRLTIPVCRVEDSPSIDLGEAREDGMPPGLAWAADPPAEGSGARRLLTELLRRDLVIRTFRRARAGLAEVFPDSSDRRIPQ